MPPYLPTFAQDFGIDRTTNIFDRIRRNVVVKNESWDIFIAQRRGAGKSTVAIRLAMMLDPYFTMDHVCFTVTKFVGLLTSRLRPGTVLVFDDLGTQEGGSSRKWQKKEAQDLADIMQLNRTDGIITIATSLELERGEKRLRAGFSLMVDPGEKLSNADTGGHGLASRIKMRQKVVDVFDGDVKWQYMRYASGGRIVAIDISHPPVDFWLGEYKAMRNKFLQDIKEHRKDEIDDERTVRGTGVTAVKLAEIIGTKQRYVKYHRKALGWLHDKGAISYETGISHLELYETIKDVFHVKATSSIQRHLAHWTAGGLTESRRFSGFEKGGTGRRDSLWWLTEKGIRIVMREPL